MGGCATAGRSGTLTHGHGVSPSTSAPTSAMSTRRPRPRPQSPPQPPIRPVATEPTACGGVMVADRPVTADLDPLLLTLADIPRGHSSSGPDPVTTNLLFGDEVPPSVPVAAVTFFDSSGPSSQSLEESLAREPSAQGASEQAQMLEGADARCGAGGIVTVDLPGAVPPPGGHHRSSEESGAKSSRAPRSTPRKGPISWRSAGTTFWTPTTRV